MDSYDFEFLPLEGKVDKHEGVIRDVSVITAGVEARGHKLKTGESLHTDMKTLEQMQEVGNTMIQVPVKWNHRTGADAVNGYLCNFGIEGNKLKADWVLLKAHERFNHAMEIAEKMPKGVGLSASFRGKSEVKSGKAFARCEELPSVDLVATPAANPDGLFEEGPHLGGHEVDTTDRDMSETKNAPTSGEKTVDLGDVMDALTQISDRLVPLEEFQQEVSEAVEAEEVAFAEQEVGESQHDLSDESGVDPIQYFESRLAELSQEAQDVAEEKQFEEHEQRVHDLCALNKQLVAENDAMAAALHDLNGGDIEFSAGSEDDALSVILPGKNSQGLELTDFQARCHELEAGGKEPTEAITLAIGEDEGRYTQHLSEIGGIL